MDHTKLPCPACGSEDLDEKCIEIEFDYGRGPGAAKLKAWVPHMTCCMCGFGFLDHRGSAMQDAVAQAHRFKKVRAENKTLWKIVRKQVWLGKDEEMPTLQQLCEILAIEVEPVEGE